MLNKKKRDGNSIVTIDSYLQSSFKFDSSEVDILDPAKGLSHKSQFYISYIKLKNLSTTTVEISKSISEEDIANIISIKTYEELNLDTANDYKIAYIEMISNNSENRIFNVFAISNENITNIFQSTINNVKYIDYIAISPLLYKAMYRKNLLPNTNVDCFLNFQKDDAFLVVYQGGEYFVSRPIRYTLAYIKDKFCEQAGERMNDQAFYHMLKQNGFALDDGDNVFSKTLGYVVEECIGQIRDIINSLNRIYDITINNILIDTEIGSIKDFSQFISGRLEIPASDLNANIILNTKNISLPQIHNLMNIEALNYQENLNDDFNFSIFKRPDSFAKRKSGKFILTILAVTILSLAYPVFNYSYGLFLNSDADVMQEEYDVAYAEELRIKSRLVAIADETKSVRSRLEEEEKRLDFRKNLLKEIDDKKNNYKMKSVIFYELSNYLNENEVKVKQIYGNDKNITIRLESNSDKRITELIKAIASSPSYSVGTKEISFIDNPTKFYESNISVEIK